MAILDDGVKNHSMGKRAGIRAAYCQSSKTPFFCGKVRLGQFRGGFKLASRRGSVNPANLDKRVRLLEAKIIELSNEQRSSAELIKSLAEQNALVVEAIEVFRVRVKILLIACISLVGVLAGVVFWLATR